MSPITIAYCMFCIFLAAIVRGFSGFGFSLLAITSISLVVPPAQIIPSIYILEIIASIRLLPEVWKDVHWRSLAPLLIGCFIGTPLGIWLLANVPTPPMQIALGIFVLGSTILLAIGFALKSIPGKAASATVGVFSGMANGAFGIGGPPVILFYFSSPAGNAIGRASMIAFIFATDVIALSMQTYDGLDVWSATQLALIFLPPLLLGIWIGTQYFKSVDPALFRKIVLGILGVLAVVSIVQGLR